MYHRTQFRSLSPVCLHQLKRCYRIEKVAYSLVNFFPHSTTGYVCCSIITSRSTCPTCRTDKPLAVPQQQQVVVVVAPSEPPLAVLYTHPASSGILTFCHSGIKTSWVSEIGTVPDPAPQFGHQQDTRTSHTWKRWTSDASGSVRLSMSVSTHIYSYPDVGVALKLDIYFASLSQVCSYFHSSNTVYSLGFFFFFPPPLVVPYSVFFSFFCWSARDRTRCPMNSLWLCSSIIGCPKPSSVRCFLPWRITGLWKQGVSMQRHQEWVFVLFRTSFS